jgi:hypothetical protein
MWGMRCSFLGFPFNMWVPHMHAYKWAMLVAMHARLDMLYQHESPTLFPLPIPFFLLSCICCTLLKTLFWERGLISSGWKSMIYDRTTMVLVHWRRLWSIWTSGVVLVEVVLQLQETDHCSGTFFLFFLFRGLCASVMSLLERCVIAEDGCNWCLLNINIYSLSKKKYAAPIVTLSSLILFC